MPRTKPYAIIMLYFSGLGMLLSGYLSYYTLFVSTGCSRALLTCGANPVRFFGVPQCVLGFVMFTAVAAVAVMLLDTAQPKRWMKVQLWLGVVGTLFAASLSTYELWFQMPAPTVMPACVYGFFLYLGVLLVTLLARSAPKDPITSPPTQ